MFDPLGSTCQMFRPYAAMIASGLVSLLLYPLDTLQTRRQFSVSIPATRPYAGVGVDLIGTCATTGVYFQCYEQLLHTTSPAIASGGSVLISGLVNAPISVTKRRIQVNRNNINLVKKPMPLLSNIRNTYSMSIIRQVPKNVIKYSIYEPLLYILSDKFNRAVCGGLAGAVATTISNLLTGPLEIMKIRASLGLSWKPHQILKEFGWKGFFKGFDVLMVASILGNIVGHAILEYLSPRL